MATPRPCAPGRLELVQEFVNSHELPDGEDDLSTTKAAGAWLRRHGVRTGRLTESERHRLVDVREALRSLLQGNAGHEVDPRAATFLTIMFNEARLAAVMSASGARLVPAGTGMPGFLGQISAAIVEATLDGTWTRLKVCRDDECRWAFYDHSKNGCSVWCSMRVCGSRAKARTYRVRLREAVTGSGG